MQTKNRTTAGLLALFFGGLGVHHFYLNNAGRGFLYLIFCWTFIPAIAALIEAISYLTMSDEEFGRRFGVQVEPSAGGRDVATQLADYAALRDSGALTEEEFAAKKQQLLK
jgi:TM2 domain-containing membrane protein YozV